MRVAIDIDGMMTAHPMFFEYFIPGMQKEGCEVGILTGRPESQKKPFLEALEKGGYKLQFAVFKPDDFDNIPNGIWKAVMCKYLKIDILFDDMQHDDPEWVADFIQVIGDSTIPFTSITPANKPDGSDKDLKDYVEQILDALNKQ